MEPIIKVRDIGKKYTIAHSSGGYLTVRDILASALKNPFKFLAQKTKQIVGKDTKEEFWALKNINFEINKGEVVGIIGPNGAGKSTLLKILTGITPPTIGEIRIEGKIASLLEVGTGFHPELTGRENIFLNGAILGMPKKEIIEKIDQIVDFAGVRQFLDTPVKFFSSGMYVRLAFSVAAHMEPEILLVDEVLAVGDAEFQKKCLGKMEEVTKKAGRTILFVSHNMSAIQSLCKRCIFIEKGRIVMFDETDKVINYYLNSNQNLQAIFQFPINLERPVQITKVSILDKNNKATIALPLSEEFTIEIEFTVRQLLDYTIMALFFYSANGELLLFSSQADTTVPITDYQPGNYNARIKIPAYLFNNGRYTFTAGVFKPNTNLYESRNTIQKNLQFEIFDKENLNRSTVLRGYNDGKMGTILNFAIKKTDAVSLPIKSPLKKKHGNM
jgi:lipopolysaccharide transport system ATP-binding protein